MLTDDAIALQLFNFYNFLFQKIIIKVKLKKTNFL